MINIDANSKNHAIIFFVKKVACGDCECNRTCVIIGYFNINNCTWNRRIFKVIKKSLFLHSILSVIVSLFLPIVISINCYYYYVKRLLKNKNSAK